MNLNKLTITEAINGLKEGKFSSKELVEDCFKRIKDIDEKVRAFVTVCENEALKEAEASDTKIQTCLPAGRDSKDTERLFEEFPLLGIPEPIRKIFLFHTGVYLASECYLDLDVFLN